MTTPGIPTPETDAEQRQFGIGENRMYISADFARDLERRLAAATAELEAERRERGLKSIDRICNTCGGEKDSEGRCAMCLQATLNATESQLAEAHKERDEALRDRDLNAEAHVQAVSALIAANAEVDKLWALLQRSKETFDWLYDRHGAQSAKLRSQEIAAMSNPTANPEKQQ